eukprot:1158108-Pelagomonas_calceolata.AAC.13
MRCVAPPLQVSMSLPASMATANFAGCLSLELWGARMLMCCHTTLLLPHTCAPVCKELQDWAVSLSKQQQQQQQQLDSWPQHHSLGSSHFGNGQLSMPAGASDVGGYQAFANDLGEWLQVIGQWQKGDAECRLGAAAGAGTEGELNDATGSSLILDGEDELQVMAAVGKDLLFTSVRTGMASLAGVGPTRKSLPVFGQGPAVHACAQWHWFGIGVAGEWEGGMWQVGGGGGAAVPVLLVFGVVLSIVMLHDCVPRLAQHCSIAVLRDRIYSFGTTLFHCCAA